MLSVSLITKHRLLFVCTLLCFHQLSAQENSPFSRYGIGEEYPNQHVATKGMGGITTTYADGQAINVNNPASYGSIALVTYDLGFSIDRRTLKSTTPLNKYSSTNFIPNYVLLGVPLSKGWGMAFGFRPVTRVNYSIIDTSRAPLGSTRIQTLYEGNGGMNEFFWGLGKKFKTLSLGFNVGYNFGRKETNTRTIPADTVFFYKGNKSTVTTYGGIFLNGGLQYDIPLKVRKDTVRKTTSTNLIRIGAFGSLGQEMTAKSDILNETFQYTTDGAISNIDTVEYKKNADGKIKLPRSYRIGLMYINRFFDGLGAYDKWTIGAEYNSAQWSNYRYYGEPDKLVNSYTFRAGTSFTLNNPYSDKGMFARATYRFGLITGKDFINADGNELKVMGLTAGLGFNVRKRRSYDNQFTLINTAIEFGKRGSNVNNITENYFKFSLGLSLSDIWFIKRKYD